MDSGIKLSPTTHISNAGVVAKLKVKIYLEVAEFLQIRLIAKKKIIIEVCKNQLVSVRKTNAFLPPHCSYANPLCNIKKTLRITSKFFGLIIIILVAFGCEKEPEFQKIDFDTRIDVIENIGRNLKPDEKYDYWALLKANNGGHEKVDILHEEGKLEKRSLINMSYNVEGFIVRGHHSTSTYYILAVENDKVKKIKKTSELIDFLAEINTMEEALLLTQIKEFGIDYSDERGGSYRKVKDGYEFYLMKSNSTGSMVVLEFLENTQYLVSVNKSGILNSTSCGIYCQGKKECIYCE